MMLSELPDRKKAAFLPEEGGFLRLITNPIQWTQLQYTTDMAVLQTRAYLAHVFEGNFCPFVPGIEKWNGYYLSIEKRPIDETILSEMLTTLEAMLGRILQEFDHQLITTIGAFGHLGASTVVGLSTLESFRVIKRPYCMEKGYTLAIAHPLHGLGGNKHGTGAARLEIAALFRSDIPLLMLRTLHERDRVFMKSGEEIALFENGLRKLKEHTHKPVNHPKQSW